MATASSTITGDADGNSTITQETKELVAQMVENPAEHEWLARTVSLILGLCKTQRQTNSTRGKLKSAHETSKHAALDPAFALNQPAHRQLVDLIVQICQSVNDAWHYFPRTNQILAVLSLFSGAHRSKGQRGRLIEMATGEGKTVVVAMFAALLALLGHKVDIITSSQFLAKRDAVETKPFFDQLALRVASCAETPVSRQERQELENFLKENSSFRFTPRHVDMWCRARQSGDLPQNLHDPQNLRLCTGTTEDVHKNCKSVFPDLQPSELPLGQEEYRMFETYHPKTCYNADVTYGTTMDYEGDLLRHELYAYGTRDMSNGCIRPLDVVICDECDSLQVDGALHSTQLTNKIFGMSYLNLVLAVIWSQVSGLRERGLRDDEAPDRVRFLEKDQLIDHVTRVVRDALDRGAAGAEEAKAMQIRLPPHLTDFAKSQLRTLVASACQAHEWTEKIQYVVGLVDGELDILPVNLGTGETQNRMHYSDGLHEFLQMKHGIPLAEMSLVDNKMSNKALFNRYNFLFGLSGTLGDAPECSYLKSTYKVDIEKIPCHKKIQRQELRGSMFPTKGQWESAIVQSINRELKSMRAVLVISENELMARQLHFLLSTAIPSLSATLYVRNETDKDAPNRIDCNQVIISTNLAGRGTDLNISENLEQRGGLHVIVTCLPDNNRVKRQAFGRAGRKGQPGSAEVLACAEGFDGIDPTVSPEHLFSVVERLYNEHESRRVGDLARSCRGPDAMEACFMKLLTAITECRSNFRKQKKSALEHERAHRGNLPKEYLQGYDADLQNFESFAVAAVLEKFSFWKKYNEDKFLDQPEQILSVFEQSCLPDCVALLHNLTSKLRDSSFSGINIFLRIDKGSTHDFASQHQLASALYSEVISEAPSFASFAHFNRAWSYIAQERFDEANRDFDSASYLIENEDLPRLCSMAVMLANSKKFLQEGQDDRLSAQIDLQQKVYVAVLSNIGEAKHKMAEIRNKGDTPGAYLVDSLDPTSKMSLKRDLDMKTRQHFRFLGLYGFVQVYCKKKKETSPWNAIICGLIGVCQVVGGALLTAMSGGLLAQVGFALIFEGVSDIAYAIEHGIKGDFAWGSWAVKKAVSLAVSALTLGLGGFAGAAAGKGAFQMIGRALFNELTARGIHYVVDKVLQEAIRLFIKKLGSAIRSSLIPAVKSMAKNAGCVFQDAIESAAYFACVDEKLHGVYMGTLGDLMRHVLGRPTVDKMVADVASTVATGLGNVTKPDNEVGVVLDLVEHIAKVVDITATVREVLNIFAGDRVGLRQELQSLPKVPEECRQKKTLGSVFSDTPELHTWLEAIGAIKGPSVLANFESKIASSIKTKNSKSYIDVGSTRYEVNANFRSQIEQVLRDCQLREQLRSKTEHIELQVLESWAQMAAEYVVDRLTRRLLEGAANQLKSFAQQFTNQYLQSSTQARSMIETYKNQKNAVDLLLADNKPMLSAVANVTALSGLTSQPTTLRDAAKFTTAVEALVRGDVQSALANMTSTSQQSVLTAVCASSEKASTVLGDLPAKKLQEFACCAIAFVQGDLQRGLDNLRPVANLPPGVARLISIGRQMHEGNLESALQELGKTEVIQALENELVKSKLGASTADLIQLARCTQQVGEGKFDQALVSLKATQFAQRLSSELSKGGSIPQSLLEASRQALPPRPQALSPEPSSKSSQGGPKPSQADALPNPRPQS